METRFRLYGINTPERGQPNYATATAMVNGWAEPGNTVLIKTFKSADKYGRWLAEIWVEGVSLNVALIHSKLAVPYMVG